MLAHRQALQALQCGGEYKAKELDRTFSQNISVKQLAWKRLSYGNPYNEQKKIRPVTILRTTITVLNTSNVEHL